MWPILRSYKMDVVSKLEKMKHVQLEDLGTITYPNFIYHMHLARAGDDKANKNVLISGGMHGCEPGGVFAILEFLENHVQEYLEYFNFFAYPCLNPTGFETCQRESGIYLDLNNTFEDSISSIEARLVRDSLNKGPNYLFTVDMHECESYPDAHTPNEFFMWELCADKEKRVGPKIIEAVELDTIVCKWDNILGEESINGVIYYPEACKEKPKERTTLDTYLFKYRTKHAFTTETPIWMPLEKRAELQIRVLTTILDEYKHKLD